VTRKIFKLSPKWPGGSRAILIIQFFAKIISSALPPSHSHCRDVPSDALPNVDQGVADDPSGQESKHTVRRPSGDIHQSTHTRVLALAHGARRLVQGDQHEPQPVQKKQQAEEPLQAATLQMLSS
jgi:hypothetical protein